MRPFIEGCELPIPTEPQQLASIRLTQQGAVIGAMSGGAWFSRKQLEAATGLPQKAVETVIDRGLRRGTIEREHALRGATKAVVQRYRLRGRA